MSSERMLVVRSFSAFPRLFAFVPLVAVIAFVAGLRNDYIRPAAGATTLRCEATRAAQHTGRRPFVSWNP